MGQGRKQISCPAEATLSVLTGRWKLLILQRLYVKVNRFGELRRALPGISEKVLTEELRQLESHGIIVRCAFAQVPLKVEYSITPLGRRLESIVEAMHQWGAAYLENKSRHPLAENSTARAARSH